MSATALVWRWRDLPLWFKSLVLGILPAAILLTSTIIGYRLHQQVDIADAELGRVVSVQNDIQAIHILLAESSLAVRGYALTGRRDFLAPYDRARTGIKTILGAMQGNIRDPAVRALHASIAELFDRKFFDLDHLVREVDAGTSGQSMLPMLIESKGTLDALRSRLGEMHAREAALVTEFSRAARQATERSYQFNLVASVLIMVGSAAAVILLLGNLLRRIRRLAVNAEHLVNDQPLEPVDDGRDELGVLGNRLRNASQLLAARAADARAANEAKSRFLSRTSHEYRTPLNAIIGHAQLLDGHTDPAAIGRAGAQIETAARHLLQLIDDILDLSTAESGELRVVDDVTDVGTVVGEALALIAPLLVPVAVSVTVADGLPHLQLRADRKRLRQVLLNLLSNAIKFNRRGGSVRIAWRTDGGLGEIEIADSGSGMTDDQLSRLFRPLERLDADRRGIAGTGLGLALSRQLLTAMGGTIAARSRPDEGSVFTLTLPAVADERTIPAVPAHQTTRQVRPSIVDASKLLLVRLTDDDHTLIDALLRRQTRWTVQRIDKPADVVSMLLYQMPCRIVVGNTNDAMSIARMLDEDPQQWLHTRLAQLVSDLDVIDARADNPRITVLPRPLQVRRFFDWLDATATDGPISTIDANTEQYDNRNA